MGIWIDRMLRFGLVGALGLMIDFLVTWLCKEKLRLNKFIANAIGFTLAVVHNYLLNRIWTFQSDSPDILKEFLWFLVISITGLGMNTAILYVLNEKLGLSFYVSKLGAIGMVFIWNFVANSLLTFQDP